MDMSAPFGYSQPHQQSHPYHYGQLSQPPPVQPPPNQIYTAIYSGVHCYEYNVNDVAVMRRRADGWLNATQILKVAGVEKGKRTKILEKEILTGQHEKIQGGYGKYQGTWISYQRGREFCRQLGVEDLLLPLLDYDLAADGSTNEPFNSQVDTPTKEQTVAANRKRAFKSSVDHKRGAHLTNGTYFENISPTASNALAAMSKAARYDSPLPPRPGSSQQRIGSQQQMHAVPQYPNQQFMQGFTPDRVEQHGQPMYAPINTFMRPDEAQEPPRKRMKASSSQDMYADVHPDLQVQHILQQQRDMAHAQYARMAEVGPVSLPPLPADEKSEEKRLALLDLFADPARSDFTSHPAILQLAGEDLDAPLDGSANTALHWAATLARVHLMRLLISRGANIFRGNAAGQSALMSAVQVNNSLDHSCFPEMLEILGPLIELRDATGRTVLHHIAVSSGIKGRSISSRYYLESLLEFVVRKGGGQDNSYKPISLSRFMSEVINVQDKSGNTALNLVARIGNRAIINQLDELGADFSIANHNGAKPSDFGIKTEKQGQNPQHQASSSSLMHTSGDAQSTKTSSQIEQIKEELFATTTSIIAQTQSQYTSELSKHQTLLDHQNASLRSIATQHKAELETYDHLSRLVKARDDRTFRLENLSHSIEEARARLHQHDVDANAGPNEQENRNIGSIDDLIIDGSALPPHDTDPDPNNSSTLAALPPPTHLRARLAAFSANNENLESRLQDLKARSGSKELEGMYKRVVALCTGHEEERIPEILEGLVVAMESEAGVGLGSGQGGQGNGSGLGVGGIEGVGNGEGGAGDGRDGSAGGGGGMQGIMMATGGPDVGRVRDFLRKVEAV